MRDAASLSSVSGKEGQSIRTACMVQKAGRMSRMKWITAWIKKYIFRIASPTALCSYGVWYEWDALMIEKRTALRGHLFKLIC